MIKRLTAGVFEFLPCDEFLLAQFSITTNIQSADDISSAFLRVTITFTIGLTEKIILNRKEDHYVSEDKNRMIGHFTMAEISFVNSF